MNFRLACIMMILPSYMYIFIHSYVILNNTHWLEFVFAETLRINSSRNFNKKQRSHNA